jgi:nicotinamidase/pyrazinamidase
MALRIDLVVIDPQVDFCCETFRDLEGKEQKGALYVKGAEKDMDRLATMIDRVGEKLDDIHVTLDSHHLKDIAHPPFWKDRKGNAPAPFTIITDDMIESGEMTPTSPRHYKWCLDYARALKKGGRYPLCMWPPHCLIGTPGANIYPKLMQTLNRWADQQNGYIDFVAKGSNILTEHYSAVQAEVPHPKDPKTMVNAEFIKTMMESDMIVVAGEASSHCVANSVMDIAKQFKDDKLVSKIVLLEDAMSPVPGFEGLYDTFLKDMKAKGIQLATTKNFLV